VSEYDNLLTRLRHWGASGELIRKTDEWLRGLVDTVAYSHSYCGLDEEGADIPEWLWSALCAEPDRVVLTELLNGRLSNLWRIRVVGSLGSLGAQVWGDDGWRDANVAYRGRARHDDEITLIYNASTVNLDIPRLYQRDIATMRVFDVLASGGFLLTEPSSDVMSMFEDGAHLATYSRGDQLADVLADLLKNPDRCREIAELGRKVVVQSHLIEHRLEAILSHCDSLGWLAL